MLDDQGVCEFCRTQEDAGECDADLDICNECGIECMTDDDGLCDACVQKAAVLAEAEEARDEVDARYQEAVEEQENAEAELAELLEQVKNARDRIKDAKRDVTRYGKALEAAEASVETLAA